MGQANERKDDYMPKIAVLTDSACDLPEEMQRENDIDIMNFKIALDGNAYTERVDFTPLEYCDMLRSAQGLPTTSQVTAYEFLEQFKAYDDAGVEQVLYVSINGTGSATNASAHQAAAQFQEERPASAMRIFIVDSHCYSMAYGYPVMRAAQALRAGRPMQEVVDRLEDAFARMEILLTAYTLKIIRKSGRISAAAAIAGELLGLHPIFTLIDGKSEVVKKVRGEKAVVTNMAALTKARIAEGSEYGIAVTDEKYREAYVAAFERAIGYPPVGVFQLGAAICSNTGPEAVGIIYMGKKRDR